MEYVLCTLYSVVLLLPDCGSTGAVATVQPNMPRPGHPRTICKESENEQFRSLLVKLAGRGGSVVEDISQTLGVCVRLPPGYCPSLCMFCFLQGRKPRRRNAGEFPNRAAGEAHPRFSPWALLMLSMSSMRMLIGERKAEQQGLSEKTPKSHGCNDVGALSWASAVTW